MNRDPRIVYGARCTWWDSIDKVGRTGSGLPGCPHCGSPLFETPDEATWWAGVGAYERDGHPGYRELVEWGRGRCLPQDGRPVIESLAAAKAAEQDDHPHDWEGVLEGDREVDRVCVHCGARQSEAESDG